MKENRLNQIILNQKRKEKKKTKFFQPLQVVQYNAFGNLLYMKNYKS